MKPIAYSEICEAFEFADAGREFGAQACVCRETGRLYMVSDDFDVATEEDVPDDLDDTERYIALPTRQDLNLGRQLALDFAREHLPGSFDEVRDCFSRRGAFGRFKGLLERRGALEAWYEYEARQTEVALREWCVTMGIPLAD